jgi:hypothetical protein
MLLATRRRMMIMTLISLLDVTPWPGVLVPVSSVVFIGLAEALEATLIRPYALLAYLVTAAWLLQPPSLNLDDCASGGEDTRLEW